MSLFDPYGLIAHFVIFGKILMQHIWRTGTEWDDEILPELYGMWIDWIRLLTRLQEVEVPRCFFGNSSSKIPAIIHLHVFVDSSEQAYMRARHICESYKLGLELQACLIGCRLAETIRTSLSLTIDARYFWTDSATALAWIKSDSRRYHSYVAFRVGEILNTSTADEWYHVPSKQNVADDATKWGSGPDFSPNSRWCIGETFLYHPKSEWPKQTGKQWNTNEELRSAFNFHRGLPQPLIDISRFSNWNRLLRAAAYVQRAVQKFRRQKVYGQLSSDELLLAENFLWRQTQLHAYTDEYSTLRYNQQHPNETQKQIEKCSVLFQESPFIDDKGVIRMNSRISAAPTASFELKYPVILPKDHALTRLLVDSYHRRFFHMHNDTVFNEVRQRFRIPQLRSVIKRIARECQHCRIVKATPRPPMMAPLPAVRLTPHVRAFSYTGVDYFGPILAKQGRSLVKRWISLFTCLTTRAVHLEIVHSLSTQSCVMAIRRFNNLAIQSTIGAPYERMVRSIKTAMEAIADHPRHLNDEALETVVLEAEAIVNSRPLTYILLDDAEQEALTLNHFLLYGAKDTVQPRTALVVEGESLRDTAHDHIDSWKLTQHLVDLFWKRWVHEYLPTLTRRTKWFQPVKALEPGDVVFVIDVNKRNGWVRGRVIEVFPGQDGQVRRAVVRTNNGVLTRPVVKLALLDIHKNKKQAEDGDSRNITGGGM
ncbi:uncharacterized protein LOC134221413 [Armigeres subalbatus]|uniref:uncharacterized protein LOC134221413 n=1 Tax=Armigeres subalbatus TaxID=124917 RepID=UPI002ED3F5F5